MVAVCLFPSADSGSDHGAVTLPGTSFRVLYTKTEDNKLIANGFAANRLENEKRQVSFPQFLALAWTAANEKAKEIGWIP